MDDPHEMPIRVKQAAAGLAAGDRRVGLGMEKVQADRRYSILARLRFPARPTADDRPQARSGILQTKQGTQPRAGVSRPRRAAGPLAT